MQMPTNPSETFRRLNPAWYPDADFSGPCPIVQKHQAVDRQEAHHRPQKADMDESRHRQFEIAIVVAVSDRRRRDLDGMCATILDCLVAARRQLCDLHESIHSRHARPQRE